MSTKGEYLPNPESLFLVMANQKLGMAVALVVEAAATPEVAPEVIEAEVEVVA